MLDMLSKSVENKNKSIEARKEFDILFKDYINTKDSNFEVFKGFKHFYIKNKLEVPKSIPLTISKNVKRIIENSNNSDTPSIFKRFLGQNKIKSTYLNRTNINEIVYKEDKFYGISYKILEKALFDSYLKVNNYNMVKPTRIRSVGPCNIASTQEDFHAVGYLITFELHNGSFHRAVANIPCEMYSASKLLTVLFDKVKPHESEMFAHYCDTYEKSKLNELNRFCVVKGNLISHYYSVGNYTKEYDSGSTLHKSCMRSSSVISFYSMFKDEIGMLSLFDTKGKLKGRALVWQGYEAKNPNLAHNDYKIIRETKKVTIVDRIYYDNTDTYNLFITYIKSKEWKTSYAQRGVEKGYFIVPLSMVNKSKVLRYLRTNGTSFPYFDSFLNRAIIDNTLVLDNFYGSGGWGNLTSDLNEIYSISKLHKDKIFPKEFIIKKTYDSKYLPFKISNNVLMLEPIKKSSEAGKIDLFKVLFKKLKTEGVISDTLFLSRDFLTEKVITEELEFLRCMRIMYDYTKDETSFNTFEMFSIFKNVFNREMNLYDFKIIIEILLYLNFKHKEQYINTIINSTTIGYSTNIDMLITKTKKLSKKIFCTIKNLKSFSRDSNSKELDIIKNHKLFSKSASSKDIIEKFDSGRRSFISACDRIRHDLTSYNLFPIFHSTDICIEFFNEEEEENSLQVEFSVYFFNTKFVLYKAYVTDLIKHEEKKYGILSYVMGTCIKKGKINVDPSNSYIIKKDNKYSLSTDEKDKTFRISTEEYFELLTEYLSIFKP